VSCQTTATTGTFFVENVSIAAPNRLGGAGVSARPDAFSVNNSQMRAAAMRDPGASR